MRSLARPSRRLPIASGIPHNRRCNRKGERPIRSGELVSLAEYFGKSVNELLRPNPMTEDFVAEFRSSADREMADSRGAGSCVEVTGPSRRLRGAGAHSRCFPSTAVSGRTSSSDYQASCCWRGFSCSRAKSAWTSEMAHSSDYVNYLSRTWASAYSGSNCQVGSLGLYRLDRLWW